MGVLFCNCKITIVKMLKTLIIVEVSSKKNIFTIGSVFLYLLRCKNIIRR